MLSQLCLLKWANVTMDVLNCVQLALLVDATKCLDLYDFSAQVKLMIHYLLSFFNIGMKFVVRRAISTLHFADNGSISLQCDEPSG